MILFNKNCYLNFLQGSWQKIFFFNFLFYIGVELINSVVLVSGVQHSDSVIHIHVSILFQIIFPCRLLQNIERSSLAENVFDFFCQ